MANTLNIRVENSRVLTEAVLPGIDKNNVLASSSSSFTAPADGIVVFSAMNSGGGGGWAAVDGVTVMNSTGQDRWFNHMAVCSVKKGQVCQVSAGYGTPSAVLYGLKR